MLCRAYWSFRPTPNRPFALPCIVCCRGAPAEQRGTQSAPTSPDRGPYPSRRVPAGADALAALLGPDGLPVPGTPRVDSPTLAALLGEAIARQPAPPRAYLLPSPAARRPPPEQLFHPRTLARSSVCFESIIGYS